jgi:hypothetical protein
MEAKLKEAIEIIENFGGFVMFPESSEEEKEIRQHTFDMEREIDIQNEERRMLDAKEALDSRNDFLNRKKEAFREMDKRFNEPVFMAKGSIISQMNELEDILLDNGLESDYLQEWIESQI